VKPGEFNPSRSLWLAALVILIVGSGLAYLIHITAPLETGISPRVRLVLAVTAATSGVCLISATARWWMRH